MKFVMLGFIMFGGVFVFLLVVVVWSFVMFDMFFNFLIGGVVGFGWWGMVLVLLVFI